MRKAFIETLIKIAEQDERIVLLTGDLGFMALEPFSTRFPKRYINVGVAEQNMVGIATGLGEAGYIPFVYSIVTFATLRPYELIRNGPILHRLPVRIIGTGGGFEYGQAGLTHHGIEDIGVMRVQHGMTIIAPADYRQTQLALESTWNLPGPVYYRIGKNDKDEVAGLSGRFQIGKTQTIREGKDVLLISVGAISIEVARAAEQLAIQGVSSTVLIVSSINPSPNDDIADALRRHPKAFTIEVHSINGGLGSLVAEIIAERGLPCSLYRCGIRATNERTVGSQKFMENRAGLSAEKIFESVISLTQHHGQ